MSIRDLVNYKEPVISAATLMAAGLIVAAGFGSYAAFKIKTANNIIDVTGSAKETVVADFASWSIVVESKSPINDQQAGFDRLESAKKTILEYLQKKGFVDIETPAPSIRPDYFYPQNSAPVLSGYSVSRQITVRSADVDGIMALAENVAPLGGAGYTVSINGVDLTYQKLPDDRVKLLSQATKDAQVRAAAIAKETGRSVGALRSASGGVVQVLPVGSVEVSDYGMYDTQSKNKDIMVTVHASFSLR